MFLIQLLDFLIWVLWDGWMLLNFDDGCLCIKKCYVSAHNVNDKFLKKKNQKKKREVKLIFCSRSSFQFLISFPGVSSPA